MIVYIVVSIITTLAFAVVRIKESAECPFWESSSDDDIILAVTSMIVGLFWFVTIPAWLFSLFIKYVLKWFFKHE